MKRKQPWIFIALILAISGILINSCTKEGTHYTVNQEFKDYFLFKYGSYWIFKNDSTNSIDSTCLSSPPTHTILSEGDHKKSDPTDERFELPFHSAIMEGSVIESGGEQENRLLMIFPGPDPTTPLAAYGMTNLQIDSTSLVQGSPNGYFRIISQFTAVTINSTLFRNVLETSFHDRENNRFHFYFAKNVGLIKITGTWNNEHHSWSLLRYHVFQ